jgi:hypothetical protein
MNISKKYHNKSFKIFIDIYNINIILYVGDYDWYQNKIAKMGVAKEEQVNYGGESFVADFEGINISVIWMPEITFTCENYSILAHEVLHISFRNMQSIGFKFDYDNTEPINYLFGGIYEKILRRLIKRTK